MGDRVRRGDLLREPGKRTTWIVLERRRSETEEQRRWYGPGYCVVTDYSEAQGPGKGCVNFGAERVRRCRVVGHVAPEEAHRLAKERQRQKQQEAASKSRKRRAAPRANP